MSIKLFPFLFLAIAAAAAAAAPGSSRGHEDKPVVPAVEGVVYCQSCEYVGTWNLNKARPLAAAKVSVTCRDHRNRVACYKVAQADAKGYFLAQLDGASLKGHGHVDPAKACKVRLLASPDAHCNLLTNVNYGIMGAQLRDENKTVSRQSFTMRLYAAGPLAFKPDHCPPKGHY